MKIRLRKQTAAFNALLFFVSGLLLAGCGRWSEPVGEIGATVSPRDDVLHERRVKDAFFKSDSSPLPSGERGKNKACRKTQKILHCSSICDDYED